MRFAASQPLYRRRRPWLDLDVRSHFRIQRPGKFTREATKGNLKGKDDTFWPAPSYLPVRQEYPSTLTLREHAQALPWSSIRSRGLITDDEHTLCNDTQYSCWSKSQSANGDETRYSGLAFMCVVEDDLVGSQFSLGTPTSLPRDKEVSKSLSIYSRLLALQAQHASSEHDKIIISALKNIQDDTPEEKEEQPLPSLFDSWIPQPPWACLRPLRQTNSYFHCGGQQSWKYLAASFPELGSRIIDPG